MDDLHTKYLNNTLSPKELIQLREDLKTMSDEVLEQQMLNAWIDSGKVAEPVPSEKSKRIKSRIDNDLWPKNHSLFNHTYFRIASIMLIPLLVLTSLYFYRQSTVVASSDMIVEVGKGEHVSLVLPDGTAVSINSESTLSYNPIHFNKDERRIKFDGEAFFSVTPNKQVPFIVSTKDMNLEVLGTKFNILSRDFYESIEVSLLEGHVLLSSLLSKNKQELFPNQKAIFQKSTGRFTVINENDNASTAWLSGDLVFKNRPFEEVIKSIEVSFDVSFRFIDCDTLNRDLFTGTFSSRDLKEALEILQKSYGFSFTQSDREIVVRCK